MLKKMIDKKYLVVTYHYVIDDTHPFKALKGILFDDFALQIEDIKKTYKIISLSDIAASIGGELKIPKVSAALTFDDGLKEHLRIAQFLFDRGLTASFFVPSSILDQKKVLPVHKFHLLAASLGKDLFPQIVNRLKGVDKQIFDAEFLRNQIVPKHRGEYDDENTRRFKYAFNFLLDKKSGEEAVSSIFSEVYPDEVGIHELLYLSKGDVATIASLGHEIGSHGHSHAPLASLKDAEAEKELNYSKKKLEEITDKTVLSLSYPYGVEGSFSESTQKIAAKIGYKRALTIIRGFNDEKTNLFLMKRYDTNDLKKNV